MKQTAVEWLEEQLIKEGIYVGEGFYEQAKKMEKEQIEKAYLKGAMDNINNIETTPAIYYNETYGK